MTKRNINQHVYGKNKVNKDSFPIKIPATSIHRKKVTDSLNSIYKSEIEDINRFVAYMESIK